VCLLLSNSFCSSASILHSPVTFHVPVLIFSAISRRVPVFIILVDFWVTVWRFPWDKSVIELCPGQVTCLPTAESSGRASTLLHLDLHDHFLRYHTLDKLSSFDPWAPPEFHTYGHVAAIRSKGCRHCHMLLSIYTGCFTTLGHNCRRWFPRSLRSKKFI
jgi:hypothetical protein